MIKKPERDILSKIITEAITKESWGEYQVKKRHLLTDIEDKISVELSKWEKRYKENYIRKPSMDDLGKIVYEINLSLITYRELAEILYTKLVI